MQIFSVICEYLGRTVSKDGISSDNDKIKCIQNWKAPETVKELKSFLGFVGYYRRFIRSFSQIAEPLLEQSLVINVTVNARIRLRS